MAGCAAMDSERRFPILMFAKTIVPTIYPRDGPLVAGHRWAPRVRWHFLRLNARDCPPQARFLLTNTRFRRGKHPAILFRTGFFGCDPLFAPCHMAPSVRSPATATRVDDPQGHLGKQGRASLPFINYVPCEVRVGTGWP